MKCFIVMSGGQGCDLLYPLHGDHENSEHLWQIFDGVGIHIGNGASWVLSSLLCSVQLCQEIS